MVSQKSYSHYPQIHFYSDLSSVIDWSASECALSGVGGTWSLVWLRSVPVSVQGSRRARGVTISTPCGFEGSHWEGGRGGGGKKGGRGRRGGGEEGQREGERGREEGR